MGCLHARFVRPRSIVGGLALVVSSFVGSAAAATNYVAGTGSNTNTGTAANPWATVEWAVAKTTNAGDVIHIGPGRFPVSATNLWGCRLACGVSVEGEGPDVTTIITATNMKKRTECFFYLYSPTFTNGNQSLSNMRLNGLSYDGLSNSVLTLIWVVKRHNVSFRNIVFEDGLRQGLIIYGDDTVTNRWPYSAPAADRYATNFLIADCVFSNTALYQGYFSYGAFEPHTVANYRLYRCAFDEQKSLGWGVKGQWNKDSSIHNCQFRMARDCRSDGVHTNQHAPFSIEIWYTIDCEFYDNTGNAGFSIGMNDRVRMHHNTWRIFPGDQTPYGVEWGGFDSTIEQNYFEGVFGLAIWAGGQNLLISQNLFRGNSNAITYRSGAVTNGNVRVLNNTFDLCGRMYNAGPVGFSVETNVPVTNLVMVNNIFMNTRTGSLPAIVVAGRNANTTNYANYLSGTWIDHNCFHSNAWGNYNNLGTLNFQVGANLTNVPPGIKAVGDPQGAYYQLASNSPCLGTGVDVGLPFFGALPDIGATVWAEGDRLEAELNHSVAADPAGNAIAVAPHSLTSYKAVHLPDAGDTVRLHFRVGQTGQYALQLRLRSGSAGAPTDYCADGYRVSLIDTPLAFGATNAVSALDPVGLVHWATLSLPTLSLKPGRYHVAIAANKPGGMVDYLDIARVQPTGSRTWFILE
jgi:hypothetical protein